MGYLSEALNSLNALNEETFEVTDDGIDKFSIFRDETENEEVPVDIIDPEAESKDELKDSYVGKVILDCVVCHSKVYKSPDEVYFDEGEEVVNDGEECPFCGTLDGFKIIGQISPYCEVKPEAEEKETVEVKEEVPAVEEKLTESADSSKLMDEVLDILAAHGFDREADDVADFASAAADYIEIAREAKGDYTVEQWYEDTVHNYPEDLLELTRVKVIEEDLGSEMSDYQKWIDYDMKRYGKVSNITRRKLAQAGLSLVKDQYGDYEAIARTPVTEGVEVKADEEKVTVETDTEKVTVEKTACDDCAEPEVIAPVEAETLVDIEDNDEDDVDLDFEEFDEEGFDAMTESYLKKTYDNVSGYKTSNVTMDNDAILVEGVITFNSGKQKATSFTFRPKDISAKGVCRFLGENMQMSKGKKAFAIRCKIANKKLMCESLTYNYKVKDGAESKRVYGTVKK